MDGASPVQQFLHVTLPQLRPVIISMAVLDLIWTSQQFALIWMTTGGGPLNATEMLSTYTYKQAFSEYEFATASASRRDRPAPHDGPGLLLRTPAKGDGEPHGQPRKTRRTPRAKAGVLTGLIVGALFAGLPVLWMLSTSFKAQRGGLPVPAAADHRELLVRRLPRDPRRRRPAAVLPQQLHRRALGDGADAARGDPGRRTRSAASTFPFKRTINAVIVSVQAVPPITLVIPYFGLVVALGLYNTYPGLILTHMVFTLPYAIIMMTAYFNTLPRELDESVKVDGGSSWTALWRILVPISVPGLVAVGVYTFMISWNEYLFALTLTRTDDMRTVPIGIQLLMGQHSYEWNQMMAMSILGSIPVLVLFLLFQRRFIGGLTAGAVKSLTTARPPTTRRNTAHADDRQGDPGRRQRAQLRRARLQHQRLGDVQGHRGDQRGEGRPADRRDPPRRGARTSARDDDRRHHRSGRTARPSRSRSTGTTARPTSRSCTAIQFGFTSVMIDGSLKPFEENIAISKKVADTAHAVGLSVEAELGTIGTTDSEAEDGAATIIYTDPDDAVTFVEETGVDSLAVAIGTYHGFYPADLKPELKLDLLKEIKSRVQIPLVLHGGSEQPGRRDRARPSRLGINKINISSDIKVAYHDKMREVLGDDPKAARAERHPARRASRP